MNVTSEDPGGPCERGVSTCVQWRPAGVRCQWCSCWRAWQRSRWCCKHWHTYVLLALSLSVSDTLSNTHTYSAIIVAIFRLTWVATVSPWSLRSWQKTYFVRLGRVDVCCMLVWNFFTYYKLFELRSKWSQVNRNWFVTNKIFFTYHTESSCIVNALHFSAHPGLRTDELLSSWSVQCVCLSVHLSVCLSVCQYFR